jgi:hypothetical protein
MPAALRPRPLVDAWFFIFPPCDGHSRATKAAHRSLVRYLGGSAFAAPAIGPSHVQRAKAAPAPPCFKREQAHSAAAMIKGFTAVAAVLTLGVLVGSCTSYPKVGGYVSDYWPHWAGGEPNDLPPRPGDPGYQEFIAHKPTPTDATPAAAPSPAAQAGQQGTVGSVPTPDGSPPANPSVDRSVVQGGLY